MADRRDADERAPTRYVLQAGGIGLILALIVPFSRRPKMFESCLLVAFRPGVRSQGGDRTHLACLVEACVLVGWYRSASLDHVHAHFGTNSVALAMLLRSPSDSTCSFTVCVGRLCELKGQLLLVQALTPLGAGGVAVELVLADDGPVRADIERLFESHRLQAIVSMTGWVDSKRVREELIVVRALVLLSFAEDLPVVIMEAMALARPLVSTYIGGIPVLVVPQKTGWLVPAGDVDALVQALREVLEAAPAVLSQLGQCGRERAPELHDIDQEAKVLARLFPPAIVVDASRGPH